MAKHGKNMPEPFTGDRPFDIEKKGGGNQWVEDECMGGGGMWDKPDGGFGGSGGVIGGG